MSEVTALREERYFPIIERSNDELAVLIRKGLRLSAENKRKRATLGDELAEVKAALQTQGVHKKVFAFLVYLSECDQAQRDWILDCLPKALAMSNIPVQQEFSL